MKQAEETTIKPSNQKEIHLHIGQVVGQVTVLNVPCAGKDGLNGFEKLSSEVLNQIRKSLLEALKHIEGLHDEVEKTTLQVDNNQNKKRH